MAVLKWGSLALTIVMLAGCRLGPEQWGPFRGRVVDVETGQAIAGAHVMVSWVREPPSLHFSQTFYDAQETSTDASGRFEIPRRTRFLTAFVQAPSVSVFAPGYLADGESITPPQGRRYVEPTIVTMRQLKTQEERCRHRPSEPRAAADRVPRFMQAVLQYAKAVCGETPR